MMSALNHPGHPLKVSQTHSQGLTSRKIGMLTLFRHGRKAATLSPCSSQKAQNFSQKFWTFQSGKIWAGFSGADLSDLRAARLNLYLKPVWVRIKKPKGQVALQSLCTSKESLFSASLNQGGLIQGAGGAPLLLCTLARACTKPLLDVHESPEGSLHYWKSSTTKELCRNYINTGYCLHEWLVWGSL